MTFPTSIRMSTPPASKPLDSMSLFLKQNTNSVPIVQVSGSDSWQTNYLGSSLQTRLENPTKYHLEQISRKQTLINDFSSILSNSPTATTVRSFFVRYFNLLTNTIAFHVVLVVTKCSTRRIIT